MSLLALASPNLFTVLGVGYLAAGVGTAITLKMRGHAEATVLSAFIAWPMLLPVLGTFPPKTAAGPLGPQIDQAFNALCATLADPAVQDLPWTDSLEALRGALHELDGRLALADRLLDGVDPDAGSALRAARAHAESEITAVLEEVLQLRLQVGLAALAGDTRTLRGRLQELLDRASALDEVSRFPDLA